MKQKTRTRGIVTDRNGGGLLKCESCGRILGYLDKEYLMYGYLQLVCHCTESGTLEFGNKDALPVSALADVVEDRLQCPTCYRPWFHPHAHLQAFAFRFVCQCGTVAEQKHKRKRTMYTELKADVD